MDFIKDFVKPSGILEGLFRDPYRKNVHARNKWRSYVTAENFQYTWDERESPHTYWVTINETKTGSIAYDQAVQNGTLITKGTLSVSGASVDANITGSTIVVITQNVKSFSLWLHPSMVGGASSVTIIVDGVQRTVQMTPTLLDALRSYERR